MELTNQQAIPRIHRPAPQPLRPTSHHPVPTRLVLHPSIKTCFPAFQPGLFKRLSPPSWTGPVDPQVSSASPALRYPAIPARSLPAYRHSQFHHLIDLATSFKMADKVIHITSSREFDEVKKNNTVVVVDFFATWCGPCKAIAPAYSQISTKLSQEGKIVFTKVDVDRNTDIARANNITAMPTFVVFRNGAETERIRGADMEKLSHIVKELIDFAGQSGGASSSATWTGAEVPKGYKNLNTEMDIKGLDSLNWKNECGGIRALIESAGPSGSNDSKGKGSSSSGGAADIDWMESDTDEQLMLFFPFQSVVKIFQIQITSLPQASDDDDAPKRPKTIKLYTNNAHILGFDEADSKEPIQQIEIKDEDWKDGTVSLNTRFVKFQTVSTLTIFVVDGEDSAESVRIDRIRIIGETGERKEPGKLEKIGDEQ
ncbi:Thioredoxin [Drechslerella dactyloides]|uniref:Thioredoxin n=1 Tax=Drechslerella dactyloides TaxID=74499 RepID=A0AAD6NL36_DREDA|nr:Thioredoxin [Drechslerella dactyloides]